MHIVHELTTAHISYEYVITKDGLSQLSSPFFRSIRGLDVTMLNVSSKKGGGVNPMNADEDDDVEESRQGVFLWVRG